MDLVAFSNIYLARNQKTGCNELRRLKSIVGKIPNWGDITDSVVRAYKESLLDNLCPSSARTYSSILKGVLNGYKDEYCIPSKNFAKILTIKKTPSQQVYLTDKEVESVYKYKVKNKAELYVKSIFLIQCYTGCRHSDAINLSTTNISGEWLNYVSIKTHTNTQVPLHTRVKELIESSKKGRQVSESYYERVIRRICMKCGIDTQVKLYRRGKEMEGEKWRFVASHTGRRTFATRLYLNGVDLYNISKWMGHASVTMTEKYICAECNLPDAALTFFRN